MEIPLKPHHHPQQPFLGHSVDMRKRVRFFSATTYSVEYIVSCSCGSSLLTRTLGITRRRRERNLQKIRDYHNLDVMQAALEHGADQVTVWDFKHIQLRNR